MICWRILRRGCPGALRVGGEGLRVRRWVGRRVGAVRTGPQVWICAEGQAGFVLKGCGESSDGLGKTRHKGPASSCLPLKLPPATEGRQRARSAGQDRWSDPAGAAPWVPFSLVPALHPSCSSFSGGESPAVFGFELPLSNPGPLPSAPGGTHNAQPRLPLSG